MDVHRRGGLGPLRRRHYCINEGVNATMPTYLSDAVTELTTVYPLIIAAAVGVAIIPFVAKRGWGLLKSIK